MKYLLTLMGFCLLLATNTNAQNNERLPALGDLKAQKFIVQTVDGKKVELAKLLGTGRPVVIDFWATWCGPCRQEIPHLVEIASNHRKDGLIVVGLTVEDPVKDRQAVKNFAREFAMNYQVAFAPGEIYLFFNPGASNMRLPQTLVFGADGKMIRKLIGYNQRLGRDILTKAVDEAVGGVKAAGR